MKSPFLRLADIVPENVVNEMSNMYLGSTTLASSFFVENKWLRNRSGRSQQCTRPSDQIFFASQASKKFWNDLPTVMILLSLIILLFPSLSLLAQTPDGTANESNWVSRAYQKIMKDTLPPERPRFFVYPTFAYAPETSLEIGLAAVRLFYVNQDIVNNRLSEIYAFAFGTFRQQYGMEFEHSIYGDHDAWFFLGKGKFQRFPLLYYGIGPKAPEEDPYLIDGTYFQFRERVLRKVVPNLFVGPEVDMQFLLNPSFEPEIDVLPRGGEGSRTIGLGLGVVYDNRHNVMNVRKGVFAELAVLDYRNGWGSEFPFTSLNIDTRYFHPLTTDKKQVLAFQGAGTFIRGDVPFNQLALMGGPWLMRGYYLGRFRDRNYVAAQAEYRILPFPFSKRIGAAVFVSGGMVAPTFVDLRLDQLKPAVGFGLRYLIFPKKDIFVRFDLAFTQEGTGFYIYTGESF